MHLNKNEIQGGWVIVLVLEISAKKTLQTCNFLQSRSTTGLEAVPSLTKLYISNNEIQVSLFFPII